MSVRKRSIYYSTSLVMISISPSIEPKKSDPSSNAVMNMLIGSGVKSSLSPTPSNSLSTIFMYLEWSWFVFSIGR